MRKLLVLCSFWLCVATLGAQNAERKLYSVAFYNLENLFDTIHDAGKNDYEFLPDGSYQWTAKKYESKLQNLSKVLGSLSRDLVPEGPAFIGVAEAENSRVLEDLVKQPAISNYEFVHYEGPDRRGIDCALLYDPKQFSVTHSKLVLSTPFEGDTLHLRGFLIVDGQLAGERVCVIVNHWPSRGAKSPVRVHAARQVKALKDSLMRSDKKLKLIVMGDMNDDPMDKSMAVALGAKRKPADVGPTDLYNPWWDTLKKGYGTLMYKGKWNLFDQIVFTGNLLGTDRSTLKFYKHEIFCRDFMFQKEGKYKGYPKRTQAGGVWLNGYSDHLPTIIYLIKEVK